MRSGVTMAALVVAVLFGGGTMARALTDAPNSGWFYTSEYDSLAANAAAIPGLPLAPGPADGLPSLEGGSRFSFASDSSSSGWIAVSGDAVLTVPRLLSGGLIARDGPAYTVRDLEFMDRLSNDTAVEFGFDADATGQFDVTDVRSGPTVRSIFDSISGFESGLGLSEIHVGASIGLGDGLSLDLGEQLVGAGSQLSPSYPVEARPLNSAIGFDEREAQTSLAGIAWKFAPWGDVGLAATHNDVRDGMLGGLPAAGLSLSKSTTDAIGASGQVALGGGWVTSFSYNEGVTQLDLRPSAALASEPMRNTSYGLAIAKRGLFGEDALGIAVSRPLDPGVGGFTLGEAATADPFDGFISSATRPILNGATQPTDLQLGYVTTFMDGALALQANAGYQVNAGGQPGNSSVAVLSRAKINF